MKKYFGIVFSIVILTFSSLIIFLPKENFSENENRYLQEFPSSSFSNFNNGTFMLEIEKYIQDHFPFRNTFININTYSELALGKDESNNVYFARDGYLIEKNKFVDKNNLDKIAYMLNTISNNGNNTNYNTTVVIAPTSVSINSDLLPKYAPEFSELERIEYIYSKLQNCTTINLYNDLKEANKLKQMYYMLDHHWTSEGAYIAYDSYLNLLGKSPLDLSTFTKEVASDSFFGTTYSKANLFNVSPDSITTYTNNNIDLTVEYLNNNTTTDSLYNKDYLNKKDKYAMFLNGNQSIIKITNNSMDEIKNDNLLIIKDSYANCFVPFIVNNFKTIHVIDPRYYAESITNYIQKNNINEVLFLYNIGTLVSDQGIFNIK